MRKKLRTNHLINLASKVLVIGYLHSNSLVKGALRCTQFDILLKAIIYRP